MTQPVAGNVGFAGESLFAPVPGCVYTEESADVFRRGGKAMLFDPLGCLSRWCSRPRLKPRKGRAARRPRAAMPTIEALERRIAPAVLTVNALADGTAADNFLTLREAITLVNAGTTANPANGLFRDLTAAELSQITGTLGTNDAIRFESTPGVPLNGTIAITSDFQRLFRPVEIEGPGASVLSINGGDNQSLFILESGYQGTISGLTLTEGPDNSGDDTGGGAAVTNFGTLTLDSVVVSDTGLGGVDALGGVTTIRNSTLADNGEYGAFVLSGATLIVENSTISGNMRGIANRGILDITQSTIVNNTDRGIETDSTLFNTVTIRHSTIAANTVTIPLGNSTRRGAGVEVGEFANAVLLENTIVADNFVVEQGTGNTTPGDIFGPFDTAGRYNFIGADARASNGGALVDGIDGNIVGTANNPLSASLGPLANYGGPTLTREPLVISSVIDAGDPNFTPPPNDDQRGENRVSGGRIDIGAVELQQNTPPPPPPPPGSIIEGQKFLDIDADGAHDPGEPGLDGWTIRLLDDAGNFIAETVTGPMDLNEDGVIEPETERGRYQFTGLALANYLVEEVGDVGLRQTSPVSFSRAAVAAGDGPRNVAAADFDGDGDIDLATADDLPGVTDDGVAVMLNNGDGTFAPPSSFELSFASPGVVAAADLDGDGDVDLVARSSIGVEFLFNDGNGTFVTGADFVRLARAPHEIIVADLDNDGDRDLVTSNAINDEADLSFLLNNGDGTFAIDSSFEVSNPVFIAAADFDGDGDIDVATTDNRDNTASIYFNNGNAKFAPAMTFAVGEGLDEDLIGGLGRVVAADLDGDGDVDLATHQFFGITLLFNDGNGRLPNATRIHGLRPEAFAAEDLDHDGDIDLVTTQQSPDNRTTVLLNDGAGGFAKQNPIPGSGNAVVAADFSGDGNLDLAISSSFDIVLLLTNLSGVHAVELNTAFPDAANVDFGNLTRVQVVSGVQSELSAVEGSLFRIPVEYTTTDLDNRLPGIGVRMHFDSSFMTFESLSGLLSTDFVIQQVLDDTSDFDSDPNTDMFLLLAWSDQEGEWPDEPLPTTVFHANFRLAPGAAVGALTTARFTASSTAPTHGFAGIPVQIEVITASLDVDDNGVADALTDGQLITRGLFGFQDFRLSFDALALNANRTDPLELQLYLEQLRTVILDVDGNGVANALTDGAIVQRYLFGFRGAELVEGLADAAGTRSDPDDIVAFLDQFNPTPLGGTAPDAGPPAAPVGGEQILTATPSSARVAFSGRFSIDVNYDTLPQDETLHGLGLRMHFDSRMLRVEDVYNLPIIGSPLAQVIDDVDDFDNDPNTDKFVLIAYFDPNGNWPNEPLPSRAFTADFRASDFRIGETAINFTAASTPLGYTLRADSVPVEIIQPRTVFWNTDVSGFFDDGANWSIGEAPLPGDVVVIDRPGVDVTVTYRGGNLTLGGLFSTETIIVAPNPLASGQASSGLNIALGGAATGGQASEGFSDSIGGGQSGSTAGGQVNPGLFGGSGESGSTESGQLSTSIANLIIQAGGVFTVEGGVLVVDGETGIDNAGQLRIENGSLNLSGSSLINRTGSSVEVTDGGAPTPGGGVPGLIATEALIENRAGASIFVNGLDVNIDGGSVGVIAPCDFQNAGTFRIVGGALNLTNGAEFDNLLGGLAEIDVFGGGVPGSIPGGGVPGITALQGAVINRAGATLRTNGSVEITGSGVFMADEEPGVQPTATPGSLQNAGKLEIANGGLRITGGSFRNAVGGKVDVKAPEGPTPGGGVPGLIAINSTIENQSNAAITFERGDVQISGESAGGVFVKNAGQWKLEGGSFKLSNGVKLTNQTGGSLQIEPPGGGVPGLIALRSDIENQTGATVLINGSVEAVGPCEFENGGTLQIATGSFSLSEGFTFTNQTGGSVEIDPPGGGVPGLTALDSDVENQSGATIVVNGTVSIVGPCDFQNAGTLRVANGSLALSSGFTFVNRPGGLLEVVGFGPAPIGPSAAVAALGGGVNVLDGSRFENQAGATARLQGVPLDVCDATFDNAGTLAVIDAAVSLTNQSLLVNQSGGVLELRDSGGGVPVQPFTISPQGRVDNLAGGVMDLGASPVEVNGTLNNDGALTTTGGLSLPGGTLAGVGTVNANVLNAGLLRPGSALGVLTINGDYTQTADGRFELPAGGGTDRLVINGAVDFGGAIDVSGEYAFAGSTVRIEQSGDTLVFINERGDRSPGRFVGFFQVMADDWGLTADVDGGRIEWANGTTWAAPPLAGNYAINGRTASIVQVGNSLTFINEHGGTAAGRLIGSTQVVADDWGLLGNIVGGRIEWANGSVWSAPPLAGNYIAGSQAVSITQNADVLTFVNENGDTSKGRRLSPTQVVADDWEGGLLGEIREDRIEWANGTSWLLPRLFGDYTIAGQEARIGQTGTTLTFTNERGDISHGRLLSATEIVADGWGGLTGRISESGIEWANGTTWQADDLFATLDDWLPIL